jgi:DHA1 family tetracycline resistance protein-like MFS transporter
VNLSLELGGMMVDTVRAKDASKGALVVLFLVTMIDMIGFGIVIPFLTYLVEDLAGAEGVTEIGLWVGLLMTSYSAAQFLFSPFWGSLSDRIGRRPVLMVGLVGNTVFFAVFGLSNTLLMALGARFLAGVFNGNIAVARAYIGDVSNPQQLATRMGLIGAAFGLGFTIGPFLGGELSAPALRWETFQGTIFETYPYLLPCLLASALSTVSLFVAIKNLPESLTPDMRKVDTSRTWSQQMKSMYGNSKKMLGEGSIAVIIWVAMLFTFGFTVMHAIFILFTGMPIVDGGLNFSEADNGRIFAMIGVTGIVTQGFLIGPMTKKFGSRKLLTIAALLTGIGLVLIPYSQSDYAWLHILTVTCILSIGSGLFQPSSSTLLAQYAKSEGYELGVVMGANESLGAFARILGPLSGGLVWVLTSDGTYPWDFHTAFHLCGLLMLCSAALSLKLPEPKIHDTSKVDSTLEG